MNTITYLNNKPVNELYQNASNSTEINKYGCYFTSLVNYIISNHNSKFSQKDLYSFYKRFNQEGWLDKNCTVLNPTKILSYILKMDWYMVGNSYMSIKSFNEYMDNNYKANQYYCLIARYRNEKASENLKSHFVLATYEDNKIKTFIDPISKYSHSLDEYKIEDLRVFISGQM